jgi:hypothetical protein
MLETLEQLVKSALLETFDIICCLLTRRQFKLVEVEFVAACEGDQLVLIVKLSRSDLFGKCSSCLLGVDAARCSWLCLFLLVEHKQLLTFLCPVQVPNDATFVS